MKIGIDTIDFFVPKTYLRISDLAEARGIEYAKLNKGLGLEGMAIPDIDEDVATMAANAALRLIEKNSIDPSQIGRIYLGTESALDAAKPTATYIVEMLEGDLSPKYGERALKHCDVVDMTFACIGAVDALENALDWVRADESRQAIVIAADMAKYDLASTGEYTQGAGAVAVLVKANPRLLAISKHIGVALNSVSDFFKPRRKFNKSELLQKAALILGTSISTDDADSLLSSTDDAFWNDLSAGVEVHKDEPVFDGPYSNDCYQERISEALAHFKSKSPIDVLERWNKLIFHLPYAYQGRRMIVANWVAWMKESRREKELNDILALQDLQEADVKTQLKALSKSDIFKQFVAERIEQGERASSKIGNMYTASIFMSLLSMLKSAATEHEHLTGMFLGFFAYGSGSKSKVFEGEVMPKWQEAINQIGLFEDLEARQAITFEQYENWHKGKIDRPFVASNEMRLRAVGEEGVTLGYRYYS